VLTWGLPNAAVVHMNITLSGAHVGFAAVVKLGPHLFVKVPRPGDSEVIFSFFVKLQPVTTSLTTQGRGNPIKCLAQGYNKQICRPISTLTLQNAERQAGREAMNTNF